MPGCHHLVSGSNFTPLQGFFSAFPHGTKYAIGLEMYLELGVDASHIHAQYPMDTTHAPLKYRITPHTDYTFTGLSPSTAKHSSYNFNFNL